MHISFAHFSSMVNGTPTRFFASLEARDRGMLFPLFFSLCQWRGFEESCGRGFLLEEVGLRWCLILFW